MNTTLGTVAATIWFRRPCASRKLRPSGVSGTRPRPTSFDTNTMGYFATPRNRVSRRASTSGSRSAQHQVRQPQGQAIHQHGAPMGRLPRQGIDQRQRLLDGDPALAAPRAMMGDARAHLVIACGRGREVNPRKSAVADQLLGKGGFAGARAAQHQRGGKSSHFGALPSSGDQRIGGTRATMPLRSTSARSRHGTRP